jgi:hypothetical protein
MDRVDRKDPRADDRRAREAALVRRIEAEQERWECVYRDMLDGVAPIGADG